MATKKTSPYEITVIARNVGNGHHELTMRPALVEDDDWPHQDLLDARRWVAGVIARVTFGKPPDPDRSWQQLPSIAEDAARLADDHSCGSCHPEESTCGLSHHVFDPDAEEEWLCEVNISVPSKLRKQWLERLRTTLGRVLAADAAPHTCDWCEQQHQTMAADIPTRTEEHSR